MGEVARAEDRASAAITENTSKNLDRRNRRMSEGSGLQRRVFMICQRHLRAARSNALRAASRRFSPRNTFPATWRTRHRVVFEAASKLASAGNVGLSNPHHFSWSAKN